MKTSAAILSCFFLTFSSVARAQTNQNFEEAEPQVFSRPLLAPLVNNGYQVDGFMGTTFAGIGTSPVPWTPGSYPGCTPVIYNNLHYLATKMTAGVTPGTNSAVWYPVPTGDAPTQLECAFYWAMASAGNGAVVLHLGGNHRTHYPINGPLVYPAEGGQVEIIGSSRGDNGSPVAIEAEASMDTMILKPNAPSRVSTPYNLHLANVVLDGNNLAAHGFEFDGAKVGLVEHVNVKRMVGKDYWVRLGDGKAPAGYTGYDYQWIMNDIQLESGGSSPNRPATVKTTIQDGVPTLTLVEGGVYFYPSAVAHFWGTGKDGKSDQPCTKMGKITVEMSSKPPYSVQRVTTDGQFSGCGGETFFAIPDQPAAAVGIFIDFVTDSSFTDLIDNGVGTSYGIQVNHSGNSFVHAHPYGVPIGIYSENQNMFVNTELDNTLIYGAYSNNTGDQWANTNFTYNRVYPGTKGFYTGRQPRFNSRGNTCGGTRQLAGYALVTTSTGDMPHGSLPVYPPGFTVSGTQCDDYSPVEALPMVSSRSLGGILDSKTSPTLTLGTAQSGASAYASFEQRANIGFNWATGDLALDAISGKGVEVGVTDSYKSFAASRVWGWSSTGIPYETVGASIVSAATIAPTGAASYHVSGSATISTITAPEGCTTGGQLCFITLIPDGPWSLRAGGNIAASVSATVNFPILLFYDADKKLWYPAASSSGSRNASREASAENGAVAVAAYPRPTGQAGEAPEIVPLTTIGSAATIAPKTRMFMLTGSASVSNIIPPEGLSSAAGTCLDFLTLCAVQFNTGGNIQNAVATADGSQHRACYFGSKWIIN